MNGSGGITSSGICLAVSGAPPRRSSQPRKKLSQQAVKASQRSRPEVEGIEVAPDAGGKTRSSLEFFSRTATNSSRMSPGPGSSRNNSRSCQWIVHLLWTDSGGICFAIFDHGSREAAVDSIVFFLTNETERSSSCFCVARFLAQGAALARRWRWCIAASGSCTGRSWSRICCDEQQPRNTQAQGTDKNVSRGIPLEGAALESFDTHLGRELLSTWASDASSWHYSALHEEKASLLRLSWGLFRSFACGTRRLAADERVFHVRQG